MALRYLDKRNDDVEGVILLNAPLDYQAMLDNIINKCRKVYGERKDKKNYGYIEQISKMDKYSFEYASYTLAHSIYCGLHFPTDISQDAKSLLEDMNNDPIYKKLIYSNSMAELTGFYKNESFSRINDIERLKKHKDKLSYMYTADDYSISKGTKSTVSNILKESFIERIGGGHSPFIFSRIEFSSDLVNIIEK